MDRSKLTALGILLELRCAGASLHSAFRRQRLKVLKASQSQLIVCGQSGLYDSLPQKTKKQGHQRDVSVVKSVCCSILRTIVQTHVAVYSHS